MTQSPLIITGMHRSGTSLISAYLQLCGLTIGEKFREPNYDNKKGFFEDLDFVEFHKKILIKNKKSMFNAKRIKIDAEEEKNAREILENKNSNIVWGWKDPRTVLFLDFWERTLSTPLNCIFIFRNPAQVVDSLIRRNSDKIIRQNPFVSATSWLMYNNIMLNYYDKHPSSSLLFETDDLQAKPVQFIRRINSKFETNLYPEDFSKVFDRALYTKKIKSIKAHFVTLLFGYQLNSVYKKLKYRKAKIV